MPLALVFTDIEGSTPLWERLGERFRSALDRHHAILREALREHRGREVKTEGDAFMIAFSSADDAVGFAIGAQERLARERWPAEVGDLRVRMGAHWGDAIEVADGGRTDYLGPMVNRAARIAQAAHGGQILLSEAARAAAGEALERATLRDLGEHRLKGLERRERVWSAAPASLPSRDFPPIRSLTSVPNNLPAPASTFVGRDADVTALLEAVHASRLVTVTGPGGTGKTRLSLRAGAELLEAFPGGVWFADLTEARDAAGVAHRAAEALGVSLGANADPLQAVGDALELRRPLLLIADNFEQVVAAAPETVGAWLRRAKGLKVLATSRFLLGTEGERELALRPLPAPSPPGAPKAADVAGLDAVRLFVERAREARPDFALTDANAEDIAAICSELEGMPLALELAAARLRVLSPAEIRARLRDRFGLLTSGRRDVTARQRSLDGAIAWSWDLLEPWERDAFAQLCAFRGGFFLDAAEDVLELPAGAPPAMDVVQALREKSFLRASDTPFGVRFGMYVALREFGETRGRAGWAEGRIERLRARIAARFLAFARARDVEIGTPGARAAIDRMELERDNLLAAIQGSASPAERADLAAACFHWLRVRGPLDLHERLQKNALDDLPPSEERRRVLVSAALAEVYIECGRWDSAISMSAEAVEVARRVGDASLLARALGSAGLVQTRKENPSLGVAMRREQLELARAVGDLRQEADALLGLGFCLQMLSHEQESDRTLDEAVQVARQSGDPDLIARSIGHRALCRAGHAPEEVLDEDLDEAHRIFEWLGDEVRAARVMTSIARQRRLASRLDESLAAHDKAVAAFRHLGHAEGLGMSLMTRAGVLRSLGRFDESLTDLAETEAILRASEMASRIPGIVCERALVLVETGRLDEAERAFAEAEAGAQSARSDLTFTQVYFGRGLMLLRRGDLRGALAQLEASAGSARTTRDYPALLWTLDLLASTQISLGLLTEADASISEAVQHSLHLKEGPNRCTALSLRSRLRLRQGRTSEAVESAREAEECGRGLSAHFVNRLADAHLARARAEAAAGNAAAAREAARRGLDIARRLPARGPAEAADRDALARDCEEAAR